MENSIDVHLGNSDGWWSDWQMVANWLETVLIGDVRGLDQLALWSEVDVRAFLDDDGAWLARLWVDSFLQAASLVPFDAVAQLVPVRSRKFNYF